MVYLIKDTVDIHCSAKIDMKKQENTCFASYLWLLRNKSRSAWSPIPFAVRTWGSQWEGGLSGLELTDTWLLVIFIGVHFSHHTWLWLRLHGIRYVRISFGSDPFCLHGTSSKLEQYASLWDHLHKWSHFLANSWFHPYWIHQVPCKQKAYLFQFSIGSKRIRSHGPMWRCPHLKVTCNTGIVCQIQVRLERMGQA